MSTGPIPNQLIGGQRKFTVGSPTFISIRTVGLNAPFMSSGPIWVKAYGTAFEANTILGINVFGQMGTMCLATVLAIGILRPGYSRLTRTFVIIFVVANLLVTIAFGSR